MFTKLSEIVPKYFNKHNLTGVAQAAQIVDYFNHSLEEILGQKLEAKALYLNDKILSIQTTSNAIAQEIQLNKLKILDKLDQNFGKGKVIDLRFKVGKQSSEES